MKITYCCKQMREMWQDGYICVADTANKWYIVFSDNSDKEKYTIKFCPFCKAKMVVKQHTWKLF